jgi:AcrR family transcriptional regulator
MAARTDAEPRKSPRQRRSRETVERILDAAARIFDERGYRGTTTNHVAELAGVSIGSLYQYFPNKDALLVALAERHLDAVAASFADRLTALRVGAPPVDEVVRSLVDLTAERNETTRLHAVIFTDCPRTPALAGRLDAFMDGLVGEVAHHLERTGTGGGDARLRARLLVSAADAAVHEVVLAVAPGPERRAAVDELVAVIIGGLLGAPSSVGSVEPPSGG